MNLESVIAGFEEDGYALIPDLLSAEQLARLRAVTDDIAASANPSEGDTAVIDFEDPAPGRGRPIQRIKKPHRVDPFYMELASHPSILAIVERLIGPSIRLNHSKINMKSADGGAALEWHQDWAFAPHTNMSTCVASVMIDDADENNGAMQVLAGSHRGPLIEHHDEDGYFVGVIAPDAPEMDLGRVKMLSGPAGTVAFHHPLTIHGSGINRSGRQRRILFLEYAASDAFPLFYSVDWSEYDSRIVKGAPTSFVRVEPNPIKLPFPSRAGSSIYKVQVTAKKRYFAAAG
jgi:ectoine hydroxylase-related dioxygenase (phytanoyl-CoA dioxygenase family)